jgi:hypothetical protein
MLPRRIFLTGLGSAKIYNMNLAAASIFTPCCLALRPVRLLPKRIFCFAGVIANQSLTSCQRFRRRSANTWAELERSLSGRPIEIHDASRDSTGPTLIKSETSRQSDSGVIFMFDDGQIIDPFWVYSFIAPRNNADSEPDELPAFLLLSW